MNGIAQNIAPSDDQLSCWHIVGYAANRDGTPTILNMGDADLIKTLGGIPFPFCPLCGAPLDVCGGA